MARRSLSGIHSHCNHPMFYPNWVHAAFTSLEITKALHTHSLNRLTEEEVNVIDEIYRLWRLAYNAKTIQDLAESFGVGLSMFGKLNAKYKAENSIYVKAALTQTLELCNKHKLRVTFDVNGPIFE